MDFPNHVSLLILTINNELMLLFLTVFPNAISKHINGAIFFRDWVSNTIGFWFDLPLNTSDIGISKNEIRPLKEDMKGIYSPKGTKWTLLYICCDWKFTIELYKLPSLTCQTPPIIVWSVFKSLSKFLKLALLYTYGSSASGNTIKLDDADAKFINSFKLASISNL